MMLRLFTLLVLLLAACAPQAGTVVSRDHGLRGLYGPQMRISDDVHHVLMGHLIEVERHGVTIRALMVHQRRDGVHRLSYREAWTEGIALPWRSLTPRTDGCTHGHCRDNAVGLIVLSEALFARVRSTGLTARLTGPSGSIDIEAPPALFDLPQG